MSPWRLIVRTLLTIPQVTTLALDLVDRVAGILNVGHEGTGDPTRIGINGEAVTGDTHDREESKSAGV